MEYDQLFRQGFCHSSVFIVWDAGRRLITFPHHPHPGPTVHWPEGVLPVHAASGAALCQHDRHRSGPADDQRLGGRAGAHEQNSGRPVTSPELTLLDFP
ncbi:hypothetical protein Bpfe_016029 [Biomphalaria pfeifferi]|uniref:Uncharacterized protein n=1 Tax=Biomphalaria pfeifferi TaxID=112525 RepID=A0AAD8F8E9_BIOPF|nr:hypothetical protein Bpfe_016029 [Biomphalaria pfeifferi]